MSFPPIVSQHGETLHNLHSDGVLQNGRLLLCDAGAEGLSYYCSDHTRTYPVSGKFTQKQKDIYNIVLAAHDRVAAMIALTCRTWIFTTPRTASWPKALSRWA